MKNENWSRTLVRSFFSMIVLIATIITDIQAAEESEEGSEIPVYTVEGLVVTGEKIPEANTIATKVPTPIRLTPASVSVVKRSLFERQEAAILGDALKNISGVNVQTGFGVHDFFVIRGFDSLDNGLVLTDGAAEPEATFYHLYNVDRVEVLKGPAAFLYGGNPLSGAVNLTRKQPVFKNFSRIAGSFGRFQSYRGSMDLGMANPKAGTAFRLNAFFQDSDHYRDEKKNSSVGINPGFTWRIGHHSSLGFNFEFARNEFRSDSGLPLIDNKIPDVPRTRSYQTPFDISNQKIYRFRIDFRSRIHESLSIRNKLYCTDFDWVSRGTLFNGSIPKGGGSVDLIRSLLILDDHQKLTGNQLEVLLSFQSGTFEHRLLTGFEFNRWADRFTLDVAALPTIDLLDPVETARKPFAIIPSQSSSADARSMVFAPYIVEQVVFPGRNRLFLGGRLDGIDYKDPVTDTHRTYRKLSPMLGFVSEPIKNLSLYANGGRAFAPPSSRVVGDREAEESTQFEVGLKNGLLDERLNATLAFYRLKKDNIAIADESGILSQTGDQRSSGMELEIAARPGPNWHAFLTYAYIDAELTRFKQSVVVPTPGGMVFQVLDRSGNRPAFSPRHLLNIWTDVEFGNDVGIGGGMRYVGPQFVSEENLSKVNGVVTFDAMFTYNPVHWGWRLSFKNLTNQKYETRGFGSFSVIPATPFAVYGSIALRL